MSSLPSQPAFARFNPAQPGAAGMKAAATGLLLVMAAVFIVARQYEAGYPWVGYIKAFAEAAMVGGLADWFAVTALFRHPLGLPIPHTAIIPRNKDRIGDALANFLRDNFLIASVVARRMRNIDLAGAAGRFLQAPQGQESRIRHGASRLGELGTLPGPEIVHRVAAADFLRPVCRRRPRQACDDEHVARRARFR